jgi:PLD-like domain/Helicase conserved C-terminal domain/SNF2-related domain
MADPKPVIATNRPNELVADVIVGRLAHLRETLRTPPRVDIATAYFNPGGYALLADELDYPSSVRLLLGAEPELPEQRIRSLRESANLTRAHRDRLNGALNRTDRWLAEERNLLGFTRESDRTAKRLVRWLRSDKVEVRRLTDRFLHGKAFIVPTDHDTVLVGSSNFTYAGLSTNAELNLARYDPDAVRMVASWFEEMWGAAEEYDLAAIYETRFEPHHPWLIYLRILFEIYGADLEDEEQRRRAELSLAPFQLAGVVRALRYLEERSGVLIADDVGLGKTFIAGEILVRTVRDLRQDAIVIAPAVLRDGPWRRFIRDNRLPVQVISYEELLRDRRLNPDATRAATLGNNLDLELDRYSLVVVDEAHNLRNPAAQRSEALRRLLAGTPRKKLVMLTATPVNNSLMDVYYLLRYFLFDDAAFADKGILSLKGRFDEAMAKDPEDLTANDLFEILDAVAVRRTRAFVRKYHPNDRIVVNGNWQTVTFPTPRPIQVDYDLDAAYPGLLDRVANAVEGYTYGLPCPDGVLSMARYMPSLYRQDNIATRTGEQFEIQLGGLLRSALLKRFESSAAAFANTCRTMAESHTGILQLLDADRVPTGRALSEWMATDSDDIEEFEGLLAGREGSDLEAASRYDVAALRRDLIRDRDVLRAFATEAERVSASEDPKLARVVDELAAIAAAAQATGIGPSDVRNRSKVLIFSYFTDTVKWIYDYLEIRVEADERLAAYRGRIAKVAGHDSANERVMFGFAPETTDPPEGLDEDLYDIVIATDVLAEGVNLQQAQHIINYDLPWNPMRLVQRHGRIDRIGSKHTEVFLRCVYPDRQLDQLLRLEERLQRKLHQAMVTFGGQAPLPGLDAKEVSYADDTRGVLDALRSGDNTLFRTQGGTVLGEEFRQVLRGELEHPGNRERLQEMPWGAGSGFVRTGRELAWVFCARVGDHVEPQLRYVVRDGDGFAVDGNQLRCLLEARPDGDSIASRSLPDEVYTATYEAWMAARDDIEARWDFATDPTNLDPKIPAVLERAIAVVQDHYGGVLTVEEADALVDRLRAPYPERLVRPIRQAIGQGSPAEQVRRIAQLADELGYEPTQRPEPLPPIVNGDIHLICWLAIVPNS